MHRDSTSANQRQPGTALYGMIVLALGMGIGRFLYTPMLPVMLHEGGFTFSQLSYIASANYAGYLVGSLLFSFNAFHHTSRSRFQLLIAATSTGLLILAMSMTMHPTVVITIRFLAGVASAGMMIFGSMTVLHYTRHPFVIASLFAGVGTGILLGNEYVIVGLNYGLSAKNLWLGASVMSAILLLLLVLLSPRQSVPLTVSVTRPVESQSIEWWQLALLYGMAGFGYIIVATYLPLIAKGLIIPLLSEHLWSVVGVSIIPGCYGWLWAAGRWGILKSLSINLTIQGICVLLTLFSHSTLLLTLGCIGFGATFMGTTSLVMPLAKRLKTPRNINLIGLVTLTYGIGQVIGPLLTSALSSRSNAVATATVCGAVALFMAAGISLLHLDKDKR
ncbi:MFS transporter [Pectobacteriaceae bacterium CE70]|nr:MFS transporter [Pectobacteriaceae bacterium C52]WJV68308.1 MFS transporter [Pectobacteriaceae bacterium CE70]WJY12237.1 MFS transporter [Pectobacteriaceae bacterium C80]